jgi:hypothetical protein
MKALLFCFFASALGAEITRVNNTETSTDSWITLSDLCEPVIPYCDGAWACYDTSTSPHYHHKYGMICQVNDASTTNQIPLTEMCPFGGNIGDDGICYLYKQVSSFGCPDYTDVTRTSSDVSSCLYKYPVFCPKEYSYFKELRTCVRFYPAICENSTDCGKYICNAGIEPIYYEKYSSKIPLCIYKKYPAPVNDAGYLICPTGEVLVEKYCVLYEEARYLDCSATPTPSPTSTKNYLPSQSPVPTREVPSQSPVPTREVPSQSPVPTREVPSQSPVPTREVPSQSPVPTMEPKNCDSYTCDPPKWLVRNNMCFWGVKEPAHPICDVDSLYSDELKLCMTGYPMNSTDCREGYTVEQYPDGLYCVKKYEPLYYECPPSYYLYINTSATCYLAEPATCNNSTQSSIPTKEPYNSTTDWPCYRLECDGDGIMVPSIPPEYPNPFCLYSKHPASPTSTGFVGCDDDGYLWENFCYYIGDAIKVPCNETSMASMSPIPSHNVDIPSHSPYPSQNVDIPSHSPYSSQTKDCDYWYCPNRLAPSYISLFINPICILDKSTPIKMTDDTIGCTNGGKLVENECLYFIEAVYVPCENSTVTATETPSTTNTRTAVETVSVTASGTITPSATRLIPSFTATATVTSSRKVVDYPTETATAIRPCDSHMCPDGMIPELIYGVSEPVCVYKRYRAVSTADNRLYCPEGGQLVNDECILYEPSVHMRCTITPTPSQELVRPSQSSLASIEKQSSTMTATSTASHAVVEVPTIIATITIEVKVDGITNSTADLSVFQNETVIASLIEAIARALGVPKETVVIESLTWVENGNILSTISLNNGTTSNGRRLEALSSLDIKYKVVDAPRSLMELKPEEFAVLVETSSLIQNVAVSYVSMATGLEINQDSINVQSREMLAQEVPILANVQSESKGISMGTIGGIAGGLVALVGMTTYFIIKRERRVKNNKQLTKVTAIDNVEDVIGNMVNVVNPVHNGGIAFDIANKYYSHPNQVSMRELPGMFSPQQARRSLV